MFLLRLGQCDLVLTGSEGTQGRGVLPDSLSSSPSKNKEGLRPPEGEHPHEPVGRHLREEEKRSSPEARSSAAWRRGSLQVRSQNYAILTAQGMGMSEDGLQYEELVGMASPH